MVPDVSDRRICFIFKVKRDFGFFFYFGGDFESLFSHSRLLLGALFFQLAVNGPGLSHDVKASRFSCHVSVSLISYLLAP